MAINYVLEDLPLTAMGVARRKTEQNTATEVKGSSHS